MSTRLPGALYKRVFDRGLPLRGRLFNAWVLRGDGGVGQAGVVVSKKSFHDAVDRNRAKRLLREAFRLSAAQKPFDAAWVFVGRSSLAGKSMQDVKAEIDRMAAKRVHP